MAIPLGRITIVTGVNGSGKSSLYRALRLLAGCALGDAIGSLAREGGLSSALWAGPESLSAVRRGEQAQALVRGHPIALRLGIGADGFSYLVDLGIPARNDSYFDRDPEIKREVVWGGPTMRSSTLVARRRGGHVETRDDSPWEELPFPLPSHASMLDELPILRTLRDDLARWRFYDSLRTDPQAPARRPHIGTRTWALSSDGSDVAAALATIMEHGAVDVTALLAEAFPDVSVGVTEHEGIFDLAVRPQGMLRDLRAAELSDGTLRYLMLLAALHAPRRPPLMAINEPENSVHPGLIAALGKLIATAAEDTQIVVVTHSASLVEAIRGHAEDTHLIRLVKDAGETLVDGQTLLSRPPWDWGTR